MIKVISIESDKMKLMPYTMAEDNYITNLHQLASNHVFDDVERNSVSIFKDRIKQSIETDTIAWICWIKKPAVRVGLVYYSHVIPNVSALFHAILDTDGYKQYIRNNGVDRVKVMEEAAILSARYLFNTLKLQRISGMYFVHNAPMINLCKRLGFKEEGVVRHGTVQNGIPTDMIVLGLLRNELK